MPFKTKRHRPEETMSGLQDSPLRDTEYLVAIFYLAREGPKVLSVGQIRGLFRRLRDERISNRYETMFDTNALADLDNIAARGYVQPVPGKNAPSYYQFNPGIDDSKEKYAGQLAMSIPERELSAIRKWLDRSKSLAYQ